MSYGSNATFTVSVTGTPPLAYQWLFNGTNIAGANATTLTVFDVRPINTGNYWVIVSNSSGTVTSQVAVLSLATVPIFNSFNAAGTYNNPVTDPIFTIVNHTHITSINNYHWNNGMGATPGLIGLKQIVAGVSTNEIGQWQAVGYPGLGGVPNATWSASPDIVLPPGTYLVTDSSHATWSYTLSSWSNGPNWAPGLAFSQILGVALPSSNPTINSQPTNITVYPGDTAAFHVTATGSAPLAYQWYFGFTPLANGGRFSGVTSADLTISGAELADAGNYRVLVADTAGSTNSQWATLILSTQLVITTNPVTQSVSLGGPATFQVSAVGPGPLSYQWYFNGTLINGATGFSYTLPVASAGSEGSYQVAVWNTSATNWSTVASLWLDALKMYAGVNVYGPTGSNVVVQYATNLAAPVEWFPLQTVTVATNPTVIIDYSSPDQPKRFYRTVPQ